jgi:hypothetical protein
MYAAYISCYRKITHHIVGGQFMLPAKYAAGLLVCVNVATDAPPSPPSNDVFAWGEPQYNPPRMNLQLTVQPLAPAPGRRSLIWPSNHGNQPASLLLRCWARLCTVKHNAGNSVECIEPVAPRGDCLGNESMMDL